MASWKKPFRQRYCRPLPNGSKNFKSSTPQPLNLLTAQPLNPSTPQLINYLAHAYLSFSDPETLAGNMISDFVKGKTKYDYSQGIQRGINLHRAIDRFTDQHEAVLAAKQYFRPVYRLYSGAMVDVVFDHYLAISPTEFSEQQLSVFSKWVYSSLEPYKPVFPEKFAYMFPYMKEYDWLYNYRKVEGIEKSLAGVVRRAAYLEDSSPAFEAFESNYEALQDLFIEFFPQLKKFAFDEWENLKHKKI